MGNISFIASSKTDKDYDASALHLYTIAKGDILTGPPLEELNQKSDTAFEPKFGESSKVFIHKNATTLVVGLGDSPLPADLIELGGKIYQKVVGMKQENVLVHQTSGIDSKFLAYGALLRSIKFDKYKSAKDKLSVNIAFESDDPSADEKLFSEFRHEYEAIMLVRNLVNEPANVLTPKSYAELVSEKLAGTGLKITSFDENYIKQKSMNAMMGVAQGSCNPPRLVTIEWHGSNDKNAPVIAFAGKGVTFDTGGISLKPAKGMWEMKSDMAGSAALVGLMSILAARKSKVNVVALLGLVENGIGSHAQRPGDIVTSMSGKTIEVLNTDAEGRLVLADVVTYAQEVFSPSIVIDIATLTGAIVVALGEEHAGLFSNNDKLAENLTNSGIKSGEKLWRFPLSKNYDKAIDSIIADMKNISTAGSGADSITAAQFIKRFVKDGVLWAHLDIAGVAYDEGETSLNDKGATGFGVRLLSEFIKIYEDK